MLIGNTPDDVQEALGWEACRQDMQAIASGRAGGLSTVKLRDFTRNPQGYRGKTLKVIDGDGHVIFYIYPNEQVQNDIELPENFEANFNNMVSDVEEIKSDLKSAINN